MEKEKITIYKKVVCFTFKETANIECTVSNWVELQTVIKEHKNGLFIDLDNKRIDSRNMNDEKAKELFNNVINYQNEHQSN